MNAAFINKTTNKQQRTMIKHYTLNMRYFLILLLALSAAHTFAQNKMIVHMKDGTAISYDMDKVDYVEVEPSPEASPSPESIVDVIGGTQGNEIDLGLSVKWANQNIGSISSSDIGGRYSWDNAQTAIAYWGDGWRLPSEEEWKELFTKCTWSWTIIDGIGGRLVTGPSGNSIFFPATGFTYDDSSHVVGCIGIYWTSSNTAESSASNMTGTYFDSANIYNMDFPRTNLFSVRPVK